MLRPWFSVVLAFALLAWGVAFWAPAFAEPSMPQNAAGVATLQDKPSVDDNDDTRVAVQLIVAGIAAGVVVLFGSAAYLLRRKLGLVAPPPDGQSPGHH